jgi:hypothetical protein
MDLLTHASKCEYCWPPLNRYCDEGRKLRIEQDAEYYARSLIKIESKTERTSYMSKFLPRAYFDMPALKQAITTRWQELKQIGNKNND